jgi:hypothetical protein
MIERNGAKRRTARPGSGKWRFWNWVSMMALWSAFGLALGLVLG